MVSKYNTERKYKEGQQNRKDIFEFIENYINLYQYPPSNREIEEATGLSKATVQRHMKKLELDGILATDHPNTPRAYRIVGYEYRRVRKHEIV